MNVLGFDIGGANIKVSDADGQTAAAAFPMWTDYAQLSEVLRLIGAELCAQPDMIAATMTGELADCFELKSDGVKFIIDAIEQAFPEVPIRIWMTSGEFAEPADAREFPTLVAAANWQALATWVGRAVPDGPAILMDVGSTTTDIIPLLDGRPVAEGQNDVERLLSGELVYSGAHRTPVCAVVDSVPLRDAMCPIAAEVFATTADALVVACLREEDPNNTDTADGRPLTILNSQNRLAHLLCCDRSEVSEEELRRIADHILTQQFRQFRLAVQQVLTTLQKTMQQTEQRSLEVERPVAILSGSGAAVAAEVIKRLGAAVFQDVMFLPEMFDRPIAESACAFAVARLAHDRCRDDLLETSSF